MPRFRKNEKLRGRKRIEALLRKGKSITLQGLRITWAVTQDPGSPSQLAISVPKKNFPRAVDRNRVRRLIRESFRKNKEIFYKYLLKNNIQCILLLVVVSKEIPGQQETDDKITLILQELCGRILKQPKDENEQAV